MQGVSVIDFIASIHWIFVLTCIFSGWILGSYSRAFKQKVDEGINTMNKRMDMLEARQAKIDERLDALYLAILDMLKK